MKNEPIQVSGSHSAISIRVLFKAKEALEKNEFLRGLDYYYA